MRQRFKHELINMSDKKYREFSSSLIPGCDTMLGVRLPDIRKMAKDIVKTCDWKEELKYSDDYFEEKMLRGFVISYGTYKEKDCELAKVLLSDYAEIVNNWSLCDSFCNSFKICSRYPDEFLELIDELIGSGEEFKVRVALILLLSQYLKLGENDKKIKRKNDISLEDLEKSGEEGKYLQLILRYVDNDFGGSYYAMMGASWLIAESFVVYPYATWNLLKNDNKIDKLTFNKAISKITESNNVSATLKTYVKKYKRI